ncbi:MAG TPA: NAD(P)H-binding protein [Pseudonocardiaceae bacterium]|nr:NAD(P)H-binding protein [Pseudonocardiaceae bacterium]
MILITGPRGRVGRELINELLAEGVPVRGLSRDPGRAELPADVEVVAGDLEAPETLTKALRDVDAVFLFSTGHAGEGFARALRDAGVRRLVLISGIEQDSDAIERGLDEAALAWTHLWPTAFASNAARHWGRTISTEHIVRSPYGDAAIAPVDELDVASVAAAALTGDGHAGQRYVLTGPESLTFREQVAIIAKAIGQDITFDEETPEQARTRMLRQWIPEAVVDGLLAAWADATTHPALVTDTVARVTGRPAHTFAEWAARHSSDFE